MDKSLEALLRGWVVFRVNRAWFFTYGRALSQKNAITGPVLFIGFSIFRGWKSFFERITFEAEV